MKRLLLLSGLLAIGFAQSMTSEDFWRNVMKGPLTQADAEEAFEMRYRHAGWPGWLVPGGYLRGTVVSDTPASERAELLVAMLDKTTPEAKLRFLDRLTEAVPAGSVVEFRGTAAEFTKEPFMVTFDVDERDVRVVAARVER